MAYDREEDILYLAHQLWEEDEAPVVDAHAYWQCAALQILARGRPVARRTYNAASGAFHVSRATSASAHARPRAANQPQALICKTDREQCSGYLPYRMQF